MVKKLMPNLPLYLLSTVLSRFYCALLLEIYEKWRKVDNRRKEKREKKTYT